MSTPESFPSRVRRAAEIDDATSRRILDAAVARFATVGIRGTTMDEIAEAAGVGRATLYRRFAGRDELVRATVLRELATFVADVDARVEDLDGPLEQFVEGFAAILVSARGHPLLRRLLELEPDLILPVLTVQAGPVLELGREYLAGRFLDAQRDGSMRGDVDPRIVAELLVRLCQSLLLTPDDLLIDPDDEEGLRRLAHAYLAPTLFTAPATTDAATASGSAEAAESGPASSTSP